MSESLFAMIFYTFIGINIGVLSSWLIFKHKNQGENINNDDLIRQKDQLIGALKLELQKYQTNIKDLKYENGTLRETVNKMPVLNLEGKFIHRQLKEIRDSVQGLIICMQRMTEQGDKDIEKYKIMLDNFSATIWKELPTLKTKLLDEMSPDRAEDVVNRIKAGWQDFTDEKNEWANSDEIQNNTKIFYEFILNLPAIYK